MFKANAEHNTTSGKAVSCLIIVKCCFGGGGGWSWSSRPLSDRNKDSSNLLPNPASVDWRGNKHKYFLRKISDGRQSTKTRGESKQKFKMFISCQQQRSTDRGKSERESESHSVVCAWPHELPSTRFLCPWGSPGKNCCSLLQGIFLTQGSNPGLPHCRRILY